MEIIRSLIFGAFIYFILQFWAERFNQVHKEEEDESTENNTGGATGERENESKEETTKNKED